ncbi:hypothetical protein [Winogradskyella helgolandensis]|uniref:hypothetical protein n=1 Tax=Winogradskyella helgolandensis TaxID=2697010 RepID=UPI0015BB8FE3|nr:hypothetical protein [Winogradskyella helgolandensis]
MRIQFNTTQLTSNQTIHITEKDVTYFTGLIAYRLEHYIYNITIINVHLSYVINSVNKLHSICCVLNAKFEGQNQHSIRFEACNANIVLALLHGIDQLKFSLIQNIKVRADALPSDERIFNIRKRLKQVALPT